MLMVFEEVLLLSIHQEKGTFIGWAVDRLRAGVVGGVLAELALMGRIQASDNHRLRVLSDDPTEDELLNGVLNTLKESEKERKFGYWIDALNHDPDKFRKQIVERLIQKGLVAQEEDHLSWVVPSPLHKDLKASSKYYLNNRLRTIILAQGKFEGRDIALLSVMRGCNLLDLIFLRDERRYASRCINELVVRGAMKDSLTATIQEIESAIANVVEDD
jgi:hypothetical protein